MSTFVAANGFAMPCAAPKPRPAAPLDRCARCNHFHAEHDLRPEGFACADRRGVFIARGDSL